MEQILKRKPIDLLSDIIVFSKYAKYLANVNKKENWYSIAMRNAEMHAKKYPQIADEIYQVYARSVLEKEVVGSMRGFQFGGKAIEVNNTRMFNCAAMHMNDYRAFHELMFLLLGGSGVGVSIQKQHIACLPTIKKPKTSRTKKFYIRDDIMGWADAIKALMRSYFECRHYVEFDFSEIRKKGEILKTAGGKAPGPEPLKECIAKIRAVIDRAISERGENTRLTSTEVLDIACHISDSVLAGGIRRSAMIAFFSIDDDDMFNFKGRYNATLVDYEEKNEEDKYKCTIIYRGKRTIIDLDEDELQELKEKNTIVWYKLEPQRGRVNISVILKRSKVTEKQFKDIMKVVEASNAGEPGVYWTNDLEYISNPCVEISLRDCGFCNLTELVVREDKTLLEVEQMVRDAVFIGTLQAGYTEFHYIRDQWRDNAEEDALLGVSITGIGSGFILDHDLKYLSKAALDENERVAKLIGINKAKRIGCVKPSGTASLVLKCSSGIHAWHNDYYVRRFGIEKTNELYDYCKRILGDDFIEDNLSEPDSAFIVLPIKAPDKAILRTETPFDLLERVKKFRNEWIVGSHREGVNTHNVSVTVSVKADQWEDITNWMWENKEFYNGISLLDYDGGTYQQTPFEDITKERYDYLLEKFDERIDNFNIDDILIYEDKTNFGAEAACAGGACEVSNI